MEDSIDLLEQKYGSHFARNYLFRDGWVNVFINGGKYLAETLIPNTMAKEFASSPFQTYIDLSVKLVHNDSDQCKSHA